MNAHQIVRKIAKMCTVVHKTLIKQNNWLLALDLFFAFLGFNSCQKWDLF